MEDNTVWMAKAYRFNAIPVKTPAGFFLLPRNWFFKSDKGFASRIHTKTYNSKKNNPIINEQNIWIDISPRWRYTNVQWMYKKMLKIVIREIKIKTIKRSSYTSTRMTTIEKTYNKCWQWYGETETLIHCWWKTVWQTLK